MCLRQNIEMEVSAAAGSLGDFPPRFKEDPKNEIAGRTAVEGVLDHASGKEVEIVEEVEELLVTGAAGSQKIAFDLPILFENERGFGLPIRVIFRQVVGEEFAVLKNWINPSAEIARFAAQMTDRLSVAWLVGPDENAR